MLDEMKTCDPYEDQLSAARYKAERDIARQEIDRMRPAFEWVEAKGGLEKIRQQRIDSIPRDAYERKRGKLLKHIAECERALGKRRERIEELEAKNKELANKLEEHIQLEWDEEHALRCVCEHLGLDRTDTDWNDALAEMDLRLMPEGYMWPEYENGDPVCIGDEFADGFGGTRRCTSVEILHGEEGVLDALIHWDEDDHCAYLLVNVWDGERVKRPKAIGADDRPLLKGETVYAVNDPTGKAWTVDSISAYCVKAVSGCEWLSAPPDYFTHERPSLGADGKPLSEGETVYEVKTGERYFITRVFNGTIEPDFPEHTVECRKYEDVVTHTFKPSQLTHERPDSWERWRDEWQWPPVKYCKRILGVEYDHGMQLQEAFDAQGEDLVRRAKALAERGQ